MPAAEDAVVMAGELAVVEEAVAEGLVPPFQGKHLNYGPARSWKAISSPLALATRAKTETC